MLSLMFLGIVWLVVWLISNRKYTAAVLVIGGILIFIQFGALICYG